MGLSSLKYLDVSNNRLHVFPEQVGDIKAYKDFTCSQNPWLPDIFQSTNLTHLRLPITKTTLPQKHQTPYKTFDVLTLWGNHLSNIPESIGELTQLEVGFG